MDDIRTARYDRVFDGYVDGDGDMTLDSFSEPVRVLAAQRGLAPDSPELTAMLADLQGWWGMLASADTNQDGRVSRDEWRAYCVGITDFVVATHAAGGEYPLNGWVRALYGIIDADGDGRITKEEYTAWLAALGLAADTDVDAAFAGFDKNDDGWLSWEEFAEASRQFWSEFDPSLPGHRWIGP